MSRRLQGLIAAALLAAPAAAFAGEIHVPGDRRSLQDAVDAAQPGDTVILDRGRQRGPVVVRSPGIVIEARGGRIVQGRREWRSRSKQDDAVLLVIADGVTVRGLTLVRGTVRIMADGVTVEDCVLKRCENRRNDRAPGAFEVIGDGNRLVGNTVTARKGVLEGVDAQGNGLVVDRNAFLGMRGWRGMWIRGDDARVTANSLTLEEGADGILVVGEDAVVSGNDVERSESDRGGISIVGHRAVVDGNEVTGTANTGPGIFVNGLDGTVEDNEVEAGGATGVIVWGDRTRIEGNLVLGLTLPGDPQTFGHGIVARGYGNVIRLNTVEGAWADGIRVAGDDGNSVDNCRVANSGGCGILNTAPGTAVVGSTFEGNGTDIVNRGTFSAFDGNRYSTGTPDSTPDPNSLDPNDDAETDAGLGNDAILGD